MAPYKPQTTIHYLGAPSLVEMAQRATIRNISRLQDVGDMPYKLVAPILKKIDNPDQLQQIEDASPHIADHSAELWRAFIEREIPQWKEKMIEPKNPRSWAKVYRKLKREEQRRLEAQEDDLRAKMAGINKKREENKVTYAGKVLAEPSVRQALFLDGHLNPKAHCRPVTVPLKKPEGPSLKNAKTGKDFFSALRKPTSNAARFPKPVFVGPRIPSAKSQIPQAPESMIREKPRAPTGTSDARIAMSQLSSTTPLDKAALEARKAELRKKEERLRSLASGSSTSTARSPPLAPPKSTTITSAPSAPRESNSPVEDLSPTHLETPRDALKTAAHIMRRPSPSSTPPPQRKRPATPASVFMPAAKKRKV